MDRFLAIAVGMMTIAPAPLVCAMAQQPGVLQSDAATDAPPAALAPLPAAPSGKSTVIGGVIRNVDPVRDQITLAVFGGRSMKILFDARTRLYRDGIKIGPGELQPDEHASVETVLDGTDVFALSVRMLSHSPEGECQGQVSHYNPATHELTISGALSREPIMLLVPAGTPVLRQEEAASSSGHSNSPELVVGSLISARFNGDNHGRGVASQITILAASGSSFVLNGNVSFLDYHSGLLVLVDAREDRTYRIFFSPARFPMSRHLHQGDHVSVTATFDGASYVASFITGS
ncbi:MAG: hypothetical protein QOJ51_5604 [Acidobacteriaceae bacterium]|jgi:hypothetical protein|nr:hypothetical protein [Acidobacteriaceae bacterium]MEA2262779.1 hypothetical protein [Acidobacteriaceae bacterium]